MKVLETKSQYLEFAGNIVPVTKSGEQLSLAFRAFRENRLPFSVRVKDNSTDAIGRIAFMREMKAGRGEPSQTPICNLNIVLPTSVTPDTIRSEPDLLALQKKYGFLHDVGLVYATNKPEAIHKVYPLTFPPVTASSLIRFPYYLLLRALMALKYDLCEFRRPAQWCHLAPDGATAPQLQPNFHS